MLKRIKLIWRMTAVRMSLLLMALFTVIAIILVYYVTFSTVKVLQGQTRETINEEIALLSNVYHRSKMPGLIRTLDRRSRRPGANLYLLISSQGRIIAGNVAALSPKILAKEGWHFRPFKYSRFGDDEAKNKKQHFAIARVFILSGDMRLMVGRDIGQIGKFRNSIRKALILALGLMTLMGVLVWVFIGRRALKRLDGVSIASKQILSGNLDERLPLAGTGDEFDRLSENLNQMLEKVQTLNNGLREVSDNIAHDLKTPITRLRNKAEFILSKKASNEEYQDAMQDVVEEADSLIKTFNALLMISRVEAGSQAAQLSTIDLCTILRDAHELYEPVAEEQGGHLNIDVPDQLMVRGNRELLAQAIFNLIDNAFKYGKPKDGTNIQIDLSLTVEGHTAILSVKDRGMGILYEDYETVKKRFVRLEKSRTKTGSGLGLSLVNAVAMLHHGSLEFKDNKPGLIAQLRLPF